MLLQFTIENVLSFADEQVLSFLAADGEHHRPGQVIEVPGVGGVLRSVVVYGANASGKSNLISALGHLRALVWEGTPPGGRIGVPPFRQRSECLSRPRRLQIDLIAGDTRRYSYGLEVLPQEVVSEWMFVDDAPVFERHGRSVKWSSGDLTVRADFLRFVAEGTRPEQTLIAELRARAAAEFTPFAEAIAKVGINDAMFTAPSPEAVAAWGLYDPEHLGACIELLNRADTGIVDAGFAGVTAEQRGKARTDRGYAESLAKSGARVVFVPEGADEHSGLQLGELSDGTRRLLWLAHLAFISGSFGTLCLDEIERSMHTQLAAFLVGELEATSPTTQFLFTTHDTNLLDADLFRRDGIWFVDKDRRGASRLYSLVEFDREQLDGLQGRMEEGYLQGRFGAIPRLRPDGAAGFKAS